MPTLPLSYSFSSVNVRKICSEVANKIPKSFLRTYHCRNMFQLFSSRNVNFFCVLQVRNIFDSSHGQDKTDSISKTDTLPHKTVRAASEAKLGISNLMHLSEKTNVLANGSVSSTPLLTGEKDGKKKSGDKKRSFL